MMGRGARGRRTKDSPMMVLMPAMVDFAGGNKVLDDLGSILGMRRDVRWVSWRIGKLVI